jgi:hypothetical protein
MAMGKRRRHAKQASMWVATQDLPRSAAHPFYARLNQILDQHDFDGYVEGLCERFYAVEGRPCDLRVRWGLFVFCFGTMIHSPRVVPVQSAEPGSKVVPFRGKPRPGWICDTNRREHIEWDVA